MKAKPSDEYAVFQSALRAVLKVSKSDMNQMLAEEKTANQGKPKRGPKPRHSSASTSDHASENNDSD
jgi:hypothetical protein